MPELMLPPSFVALLAAFADCFTAPSYENFCQVVAGWVQRLGRRTITGVALAAGAVGSRHLSVFHRFFCTDLGASARCIQERLRQTLDAGQR